MKKSKNNNVLFLCDPKAFLVYYRMDERNQLRNSVMNCKRKWFIDENKGLSGIGCPTDKLLSSISKVMTIQDIYNTFTAQQVKELIIEANNQSIVKEINGSYFVIGIDMLNSYQAYVNRLEQARMITKRPIKISKQDKEYREKQQELKISRERIKLF